MIGDRRDNPTEAEIEMPDEVELLKRLYDRFNARDMDTLLSAMQEGVIWANGMEGGLVHGREGVRRYWTRQWVMVDPHVEPVEFSFTHCHRRRSSMTW